jgi:uncharacterized protein
MALACLKSLRYSALTFLGLSINPVFAQDKPPESDSKVKRVLLYNKIGGWVSVNGIADVKAAFTRLAGTKGFELVQSENVTDLTLENLKKFQAIVWNNNTNGAASVPSAEARQAVLDYLDQGGGWLLICGAGDHSDTWPALRERMGTKFSRHSATNRAEVLLDSAAKAHRELKWMVEGFPNTIELNDLFLGFQNTVRPLPGVTVVATTRGIPGIPNVVTPIDDGSGDNVYLWAREVGRGRLFYNAIGFGINQIMAQQDSIVPKLYWEHLRYVAGDYQNGCTTPSSPGFDPGARVHVETMCSTTGVKTAPARSRRVGSKADWRQRLDSPQGSFKAGLRDIRGAQVP